MRRKIGKKSNRDKVQMWVFPDFRDLLKREALDKGTDVLSLTERLAKKQKMPFKEIEEEDEIFEPITKHFKRIL